MTRPLRRACAHVAPIAAMIAVAGCGADEGPAPAPEPIGHGGGGALAQNARQANRIVGDGAEAFERRMAALAGNPVVVNQWASWCESCRWEFPFFEAMAERYQDRVAFLGLDSGDRRGPAEEFLAEMPVGFPSIYDEDASVAQGIGGGRSWPMTFFYDGDGDQVHKRTGAYTTVDQLEADIRRFALGEDS